MMDYDNFQMPTSGQLPLYVCHKKHRIEEEGTDCEARHPENYKRVRAKIVVKTNKNSCAFIKPVAFSGGSEATARYDLRQCNRTLIQQPSVETSWKNLKPEVNTASVSLLSGEDESVKETPINNVDKYLFGSGTAVNLAKFSKVKSCSLKIHPPMERDMRLKGTNSRKLGELKNSQEMATFSTVNLLQQSESFGGIRVTSGMPGRKHATHKPKPLSAELGSGRAEVTSSPRSVLHSNLQINRSFLIKQVQLKENKQKLIESGTSEKFVSFVSQPYWDCGNDEEDAISLVYMENYPNSTDNINTKEDAAEKDDDYEINDEVEYVFEKPVNHITHKVKKQEKKSVQFEEPNAEDLSLKSLSDTDSETQQQPPQQLQQQPQQQQLQPQQQQLQQQPQQQQQQQSQQQQPQQQQHQQQPQQQPQKLQQQPQLQPQHQPSPPEQIERSPRHTLKLRTVMFSDLKPTKELRSPGTSGTENFMVRGVTPSRVDYKFEETFPLKTYLSSSGTIQQATQIKTIPEKLTSPLHSRKTLVSKPAQNRGYSMVVPSTGKEDLTVRASTLAPSINYRKHFEFPLNENEEEIKDNEKLVDSYTSSDGYHLLPAKMYRVVQHQRHKQTLSCDTPPSTPQTLSPMHTSKFVNSNKNEQVSHATKPSKPPIKSSAKSPMDSESDGKTKQGQMHRQVHNTENVNQVAHKKQKNNSKKLVGLKTKDLVSSSELRYVNILKLKKSRYIRFQKLHKCPC